jgi:DNA-binding CsgD family transcriptional regulator
MRQDEKLRSLIGTIYDAALDAALWTDALTRTADFVGGEAAGLCSKAADDDFVSVEQIAGIDRDSMRAYAATYRVHDPLASVPLFDVQQVVSIPELVPFDDYRQGRFYQEWAHPQGWGDVASAVLDKSAQATTFLNVVRSETSGMVDQEMRRRMALVAPHARRAVLIGKAIERKADETATFIDILDGLSAGVLLVAVDGRIIHANAAGRGILRADDVLRSIGGRLAARDPQAQRSLRRILAAAADEQDGSDNALPLTADDGERYVAYVLPMTASARRRAVAAGVAAAVFVRKATLETRTAPETIGRAYNLTPTELRVLLAIVDIGGTPEVADALGVANTTVKTHLDRLFQKTGAGRQADLVKIVAGFASPLDAHPETRRRA